MTALDDVNSIDESAAYLKITPKVLGNLARARKIGALKTGRTWTFLREDLEDYKTTHRIAPIAPNPHGLTDASLRRVTGARA